MRFAFPIYISDFTTDFKHSSFVMTTTDLFLPQDLCLIFLLPSVFNLVLTNFFAHPLSEVIIRGADYISLVCLGLSVNYCVFQFDSDTLIIDKRVAALIVLELSV